MGFPKCFRFGLQSPGHLQRAEEQLLRAPRSSLARGTVCPRDTGTFAPGSVHSSVLGPSSPHPPVPPSPKLALPMPVPEPAALPSSARFLREQNAPYLLPCEGGEAVPPPPSFFSVAHRGETRSGQGAARPSSLLAASSRHKGSFVLSCRARAAAGRAKRHPCLLLSLLKQQANIASRSNFNTQQSRAKQGLGGGGARCQLCQRSELGAARSPSATACGRPSARPSVGRGGCELLPEHGGPLSCSQSFAHPGLSLWPPQCRCRSRGLCPRPHLAAPRG